MSKIVLVAALALGLMGTAAYAASGPAPAQGQNMAPAGSSGTMVKKHMGAKTMKHHQKKSGMSSSQ